MKMPEEVTEFSYEARTFESMDLTFLMSYLNRLNVNTPCVCGAGRALYCGITIEENGQHEEYILEDATVAQLLFDLIQPIRPFAKVAFGTVWFKPEDRAWKFHQIYMYYDPDEQQVKEF